MSFQKVEIGNATLYHGNSLEVLEFIEKESVDAIITDPPYCSGGWSSRARQQDPLRKYVHSGTQLIHPSFSGDNKDQRGFYFWYVLWLSQCFRIAKPSSLCCLFTDWRQLPITTDIFQAASFIWRGIGVWDKTEATRPQRGGFRSQCEYVIWGSKGKLPTKACRPGVWRKAINSRMKYHMTGKPVEVMERILEITPPNSLILDPFMGSGTTGIACLKQGHRFIGIEIGSEYFDIACKRMEETQNELKMSA